MTTYWKAVQLDGTDFYTGTIRWADAIGGGVIEHHDPVVNLKDSAHYLSASTVPTDCTGAGWPCRLLEVEPVDGHKVWTPRPVSLPNKRASSAWRVLREVDPRQALGPMGEHVLALIEAATAVESPGDVAELGAAGEAAWGAAWGAVHAASRDAAFSAAQQALSEAHITEYLALDVAWDAMVALMLLDRAAHDRALREMCEVLFAPARSIPALNSVIDAAWEYAETLAKENQ